MISKIAGRGLAMEQMGPSSPSCKWVFWMDPRPSSLPGPPDKKESKPLRLCHASQKSKCPSHGSVSHFSAFRCNCMHKWEREGLELFLWEHRCNKKFLPSYLKRYIYLWLHNFSVFLCWILKNVQLLFSSFKKDAKAP